MSPQNTASTTEKSRKDHIRDSIFVLLSLWFTTLILHAIFISPSYADDLSASSLQRIPARISIPCINLENSTISKPAPDGSPCVLEYEAVDDDLRSERLFVGALEFICGLGWIVCLIQLSSNLIYLQGEDESTKTIAMTIGSGLLGLAWVLFEPFGWAERNEKGYVEGVILPVGLVVSVAVVKEIWKYYRRVPQAGDGAELDADVEAGNAETTQHERRHGDYETGRSQDAPPYNPYENWRQAR